MQIVEQMNAGASLPTTGTAGATRKIERRLASLVGITAAALLVGRDRSSPRRRDGRYVFHQPIIWSDELASILFLWLAMLGSVVALRRGEHMRMTAFVGM